jgi:hypothetical protein
MFGCDELYFNQIIIELRSFTDESRILSFQIHGTDQFVVIMKENLNGLLELSLLLKIDLFLLFLRLFLCFRLDAGFYVVLGKNGGKVVL